MVAFVRRSILITGLLLVQGNISQGREVCYPQTGCLSMDSPWASALRPFPPPNSPEKINVGFYLETRSTMEQKLPNLKVDTQDMTTTKTSLEDKGYRTDREKTVFIIHGFATRVNETWLREMADAYLEKVDANVFLVDWGGGAVQANYLQVASNTRVVGILLANFIQFLIDSMRLKVEHVHIIGHSLGSHIAGYAGKRIKNLHRITALDAAQPGFEGYSPQVRLNITDAHHIDVHHTNGKPTFPFLGFGFITALGHIDFYYNGGAMQPGCTTGRSLDELDDPDIKSENDLMASPVEYIANVLSCSHGKSIYYFMEALRRDDCVMWGKRELFFKSLRSPVGLYTFGQPGRGVFHLLTRALPPYCKRDGEDQEDKEIKDDRNTRKTSSEDSSNSSSSSEDKSDDDDHKKKKKRWWWRF